MGKKSTIKFSIDVITEKELTETQKDLLMRDMAARLEGYHTEPLLFLHNADINISRVIKKSEINSNDICKCIKPLTVNSICIICEKPYKID